MYCLENNDKGKKRLHVPYRCNFFPITFLICLWLDLPIQNLSYRQQGGQALTMNEWSFIHGPHVCSLSEAPVYLPHLGLGNKPISPYLLAVGDMALTPKAIRVLVNTGRPPITGSASCREVTVNNGICLIDINLLTTTNTTRVLLSSFSVSLPPLEHCPSW